MSEEQKEQEEIYFAAKRDGRFTKRFTKIFDMKAAVIIIRGHELEIFPKGKKNKEVIIEISQISKILRHIPKYIPYYEIILLNGETYCISFYSWTGSISKKVHKRFLNVLNKEFGFSLDLSKNIITKQEKLVFQNSDYCYFKLENVPNHIEEKKATIRLTEQSLKIWDKKSEEIVVSAPISDIELFLENILIKGEMGQANKINHKIVLNNGQICYITFKSNSELRQELQDNFAIAMNTVITKFKKQHLVPENENYKFCFNCGAKIRKEANFCDKCGSHFD
ncbi:MAG: zinc ribbon domain-containing protein [Candidatus Hodarchaeota archaeon]